jgi:hypothetical protein
VVALVAGPTIATIFGSELAAAVGFVVSLAAMGLALYFGFVRVEAAIEGEEGGMDWRLVAVVAAVCISLAALLVFLVVRAS